MKHPFVYLLIAAFGLLCCKSEPKEKRDTELEEVFSLMQGSYNSAKQAEADSTYYNISLHMYPIWKDKGNWLYVEQALNAMQERPYRQRLYELRRNEAGQLASFVYTIAHDSLWIGKWKDPSAFDSLTSDQLSLRQGCEVLLKKKGANHFAGRTQDRTCESSLRGATYALSAVAIFADKIESWDQGFDADGNQVWGATEGGYVFDKLD
ncbi:chromophore lyase CpcT/CpeT [Flagellimonas sp. DF-77]|uniref:chromophore lyase CpcT/CpeT n=1 Tax=Flagellimonas algarum TaxID=3230298 RepID=UPI00339146DE